MGKIYGKAQRVIFWLGPATYATDVVIDALQRLQDKRKSTFWTEAISTNAGWKSLCAEIVHTFETMYVDLDELLLEGLLELSSRPWFGRAWILQEVANAQSASIHCGMKSISARFFVLAPVLIDIRPKPQCEAVLAIMPGPGRENSWWHGNPDLYTLLVKFRQSKSHRPRDTFYALPNISSDACNNDNLLPDYDKDEQEVIKDTFRFLYLCDMDQTLRTMLRTIGDLAEHLVDLNRNALRKHIASSDTGKMEIILDRPGFRLTEEEIVAAARSGSEVMQMLFDKRRNELNLTENVLETACENQHGMALLQMFFRERGLKIEITEKVLAATARNEMHALPLLKMLIQERRDEIKITETVLVAAAQNWNKGVELMELLLRGPRQLLAYPETGGELAYRQRRHERAHQEPRGDLAYRQRRHEWAHQKPKEELAYPEMRNEWAHQERRWNMKITEAVVVAAAQNRDKGVELLELLLRELRRESAHLKPRWEVKDTKAGHKAVAQNRDTETERMELLLLRLRKEAKIT